MQAVLVPWLAVLRDSAHSGGSACGDLGSVSLPCHGVLSTGNHVCRASLSEREWVSSLSVASV